MEQRIPLDADEILFVRSADGVIGVVKSGAARQLFIETVDDEIVMTVDPEDLLVASGFSNDRTTTNAIICTLALIRDSGSPLIVLPKHHPASARLKVVAAVGRRTVLRCDIQKGTHPEQDVLCGSLGLNGLEVSSVEGHVVLRGDDSLTVERKPFR
ncbi:MAG TPA: hypothetical protein VEF35_01610 [Candidatus Bathyarchaeia archaeon]|nr:hypothetical protein [Candidatus Bathyarchaeia archaeon]